MTKNYKILTTYIKDISTTQFDRKRKQSVKKQKEDNQIPPVIRLNVTYSHIKSALTINNN